MKLAKLIIMGLLAASAWIVDWVLLKHVIYQNQDLAFVGWPTLATVLGITFLTFFFLLNKNRWISIVLDVIIVAAYIVIMPQVFYVILAGGIFLVFLLLFEQRLASEQKSQIDFSLRRVMSDSISLTLYALLLLIGLNIYYHTQTDFNANPNAYYDKLEQVVNSTTPYVTSSFNELTPEQKQQLSSQITQETVNRIRESTSGYKQYFPFVFAIIVTGTLWTFAFVLRWITMVVGWLIFRLLLLTGFFTITKEMVEVEKLNV